MKRSVIIAVAIFEIAVGVCFIVVPNVLCRLLFATALEGFSVVAARGVGVVLLGLGVACLPSKLEVSRRGAVLGLLVLSVGAAILFAWLAVTTPFRGVLLWPYVIVNAVIAAVLLPQFLTKGSVAR